MRIQIDSLAYTNGLGALPPGQKLLFASILFILAAIAHPTTQLFIALWMGVWIVVYAKIPVKIYMGLLYVAIFFWLTSLPALVISVADATQVNLINEALLDSLGGFNIGANYIYISRHGIGLGFEIFSRAIASISCLYFVILTIPFTELLETLRRLGFPELITELLLLMYRFIFVLLNTADELWIAQQARGGYRNFAIGLKSLALLIGQLLRRSLLNYRQISLSLESRGFNGSFRVWKEHRYRPSRRYTIEAVTGCTLLVLWEWGKYVRIFTGI
jgi:cobalt/nickel transport system permease protein